MPFFLPLYKKLKMDPKQLLLMIAIAMGVMFGVRARKAGADELAKEAIREMKAKQSPPAPWRCWPCAD